MINEALGFRDWVKLNENSEPIIETYTYFTVIGDSPDISKLKVTSNTVSPSSNLVIYQVLPNLESILTKYLPGFNVVGTDLHIDGDDFKNEEGQALSLRKVINERFIRQAQDSVAKMELFNGIWRFAKRRVNVGDGSSEWNLDPEFNVLPEKEVLPTLLDKLEKIWLEEIKPEDFSSDLESILFSWSVGGSFFNESELTSLMQSIITLAAFEIYRDALLTSIAVERTSFNLAELDSDFKSKIDEFKKMVLTGEVSKEGIKEILNFIKMLIFKLRPKGSLLKEKADAALSEVMTLADSAGLTDKLMDAL